MIYRLAPPSTLLLPMTEFARVIGIRKEEEQRRARHNLRRRAIKKRDLQQQFRRRRLQNFLKENEVKACRRAVPPPPSPSSPRREQQREKISSEIPQDCGTHKKRDGFIWSDLGRTPKTRLSLVVPPIAAKGEREFIERLLRKVETEHVMARQRAREQQDRVAIQRERLRKKVRLALRGLCCCFTSTDKCGDIFVFAACPSKEG